MRNGAGVVANSRLSPGLRVLYFFVERRLLITKADCHPYLVPGLR